MHQCRMYLNNNKSLFFYCFTNIHHCQHAHNCWSNNYYQYFRICISLMVSYEIIAGSPFIFFSKENQERANLELGEIKGIFQWKCYYIHIGGLNSKVSFIPLPDSIFDPILPSYLGLRCTVCCIYVSAHCHIWTVGVVINVPLFGLIFFKD